MIAVTVTAVAGIARGMKSNNLSATTTAPSLRAGSMNSSAPTPGLLDKPGVGMVADDGDGDGYADWSP